MSIRVAIKTMLETQATLNDLMAGDGWRSATLKNNNGFDYRRAIFVEAGEAIAHTPYKWWANSTLTPEGAQQFKMELIDIAHFLLSFSHIVKFSDTECTDDNLADDIVCAWSAANDRYSDAHVTVTSPLVGIRHVEALISNLYRTMPQGGYEMDDLFTAWFELFCAFRSSFNGYSMEDLLKDYLSKSLLNRFRTVSGAKKYGVSLSVNEWYERQETYLKVWTDGREDVEHLSDMIKAMLENGTLSCNALYSQIENAYFKEIERIRNTASVV